MALLRTLSWPFRTYLRFARYLERRGYDLGWWLAMRICRVSPADEARFLSARKR